MMVEERISWYYGIVFVLSIITYLNAIPADFVFDDTAAIQGNPDIVAGTSITSLIKNDFWGTPIGSRFSHQSYRPVTVLSFRMDYEIWNDLVRQQFHFTNVALHAVAKSRVGLLNHLARVMRIDHRDLRSVPRKTR